MRVAVVSVCLVVAGLFAALPAEATAPGKNGEIAFRRFLGPAGDVGTIFTIRPDGTGERQVAQPPEGASDDFPDYASDGSFIAFQRCAELCSLMVARPDGSGLRRVGPEGDSSDVGISPDTRRIAFTHFYGSHADVFTQHVSGGGLRRITRAPESVAADVQVQWSPDGRKLVFVRKWNDGSQAIYTVDADGDRIHRVTPFALRAGDWPDWSPDGRRILFRSPDTGDFLHSNLYTIRPDGSGLEQVTHAPDGTHVYSASYSPDGKRITLGLEGTAGAADIWTMRVDGSGLTPVTRTTERDSAPDWGGRR